MDDETTLRARIPYALIVDALAAAADILSQLPESPRKRELRARTQTYENAVKGWSTLTPSDAQRSAMLDLVADLHARVHELSKRSGSHAGGR